jgi:hypothetical protein
VTLISQGKKAVALPLVSWRGESNPTRFPAKANNRNGLSDLAQIRQ